MALGQRRRSPKGPPCFAPVDHWHGKSEIEQAGWGMDRQRDAWEQRVGLGARRIHLGRSHGNRQIAQALCRSQSAPESRGVSIGDGDAKLPYQPLRKTIDGESQGVLGACQSSTEAIVPTGLRVIIAFIATDVETARSARDHAKSLTARRRESIFHPLNRIKCPQSF